MRYQSAADLRAELKRLKRDMTPARRGGAIVPLASSETEAAAATPSPAPRPRARWGLAAALGIALAGLAAILVPRLLPSAPRISSRASFRTVPVPFRDIDFAGLSPDGKWIVFPASDAGRNWDLYIMSVRGGEPRRITQDSSAGAGGVAISPDGSRIAYAVSDREGRSSTAQTRMSM